MNKNYKENIKNRNEGKSDFQKTKKLDIKELKQKLNNENINIVKISYSCNACYIVYRNNIEFAKYRQTFETKFEGLNSKIVVTVERIE